MTSFDTPTRTHAFARDNANLLEQGVDVLQRLSDAQYAASQPPVFNSTVGAHIRHLLDHFDCLLEHIEDGRVDYDARGRDRRIETDRGLALERLRKTAARLHTIREDAGNHRLQVKVDGGGQDAAAIWSASSVTRELQFLVSHTIHHYALVAAILSHAGCPVKRDFGVSPSTLRYERLRSANVS